MTSKYNYIIGFLVVVICFLITAIYVQHEPRSTPRTITPDKIKKIENNQRHTNINSKEKVAQTYYIDQTGGNNRETGTSMDRAWKNFSILKKKTFSPGDSILLKRGEKWQKTLFSPKGGTEGKPIIIDAYGTGTLPVIDVQNNYPNAIRVYHSYVTINNIRVENSNRTGINISVRGGLKNIKLNKLKVLNSGTNGIAVFEGGTKLEISDCYIEKANNNGIHLGGSPENKLSDVVIRGCHVKNISDNDGITIHQDGKGNTAGSNFLIKNNLSEMCGEQGFDITTGENILLLNNKSINNGQGGILVGHSAKHITIQGHISTDEPTQNQSAAINLAGKGNIRLLKSVIKGNGYHLLKVQTKNVAVFNNNFIWDKGRAPVDISAKIENIVFINNIVYSKQPKMSRIRFLEASRPPNYKSFYFDYNLYYMPDGEVNFYHNRNYPFKKYQTKFKIDTHSLGTNPGFVNPMIDEYQLKNNSPAIDAGCFLTHSTSQITKHKLQVKNALFFYKNPNHPQHITVKGITGIFKVIDIDYNANTITLDKQITLNSDHLIGLAHKNLRPDIGAYEFQGLPLPIN